MVVRHRFAALVLAAAMTVMVAPVPADAAVPPYSAKKVSVGPGTKYPLTHSWRAGCPVHWSKLVAIEFLHHGLDGKIHTGVVIVSRVQEPGVQQVLRTLYSRRFPIARARPVDAYGGSDARSMAANNTSGFNCRKVAGTSVWSEHAYGRAIDVNPVQNPYVNGSTVEPPAGRDYLYRRDIRPGMAIANYALDKAFTAIGWKWGGRWTSKKDYQHFSATGK